MKSGGESCEDRTALAVVSGFQRNPRAFNLGIKEIVRLSESILRNGGVSPKPRPVSGMFVREEAHGHRLTYQQ